MNEFNGQNVFELMELDPARMTPEQLQTAVTIQIFAAIARPFMLRFVEARSCITATRITQLTLERFGITVTPVACQLVAVVPHLQYAYTSGLRGKEKRKYAKRAKRFTDLSTSDGSPGYCGHVVALTENLMLDPSFDQIDGGGLHGLTVEPRVLVVPFRGGDGFGFDLRNDNDELVQVDYRLQRHRKDYQRSDAWNDEALPFLAARLARAVAKGAAEVLER